MPFTFTPCPIQGLFEIQPKVFGDSRGFFLETYKEKEFADAGLTMKFVQDNMSKSSYGVLRGLHFQKHFPQGKLVSVIEGSVYDVAIDLRNNSPTFGSYYGVTLTAEKHNMFYIPEGFAHGFVVLSETATFTYKCTNLYHPEDEGGILWNDETIGVAWPELKATPLLSDKDKIQPHFDKNAQYF